MAIIRYLAGFTTDENARTVCLHEYLIFTKSNAGTYSQSAIVNLWRVEARYIPRVMIHNDVRMIHMMMPVRASVLRFGGLSNCGKFPSGGANPGLPE